MSIGDFLYLVNSKITSSVRDKTGNGGNILIDAGAFVASTDSIVSASSRKGISGVISIAGFTPLNGALVVLSSELRSAVALAAHSCAAGGGRPRSSLVEAGAAVCRRIPTPACRRSTSPAAIFGSLRGAARTGAESCGYLPPLSLAMLRLADAWRLGSQPVGPVVKHRSLAGQDREILHIFHDRVAGGVRRGFSPGRSRLGGAARGAAAVRGPGSAH